MCRLEIVERQVVLRMQQLCRSSGLQTDPTARGGASSGRARLGTVRSRAQAARLHVQLPDCHVRSRAKKMPFNCLLLVLLCVIC